MAVEELPLGTRWRDGQLIIVEEEVDGDRLLPWDFRTAMVYQAMGNSIFPS